MNETCLITGSNHINDEQINGESVCTACGIVSQQDLVTSKKLGTSVDQQYQSSTTTYHLARTCRDTTNSKETRDYNQNRNALSQLRGDALQLGLPDGYFKSVCDLFERVLNQAVFKVKYGLRSRLIGVSCIILVSRTLGGASVSIMVQEACRQLYLDPVLLGKYLVRIRPFALPRIVDDDQSPQSILRPVSVDLDLCPNVYKILTQMHVLHQPTTDALYQAFIKAKPSGERYKECWLQPIRIPNKTEFNVNDYRPIVQVLIKECTHLFESRHLMPCALAVACIAREATERIPCSAAIWCTLLNLTQSPLTCFVRQREIHDFLASTASVLPWHKRITVRSYSAKSYPTIAFFVGQIIDLIQANVIKPGFGEPPSRTKSRVTNETQYNYITRAIDRLAMDFGFVVVPDIDIFNRRVNDIPVHPSQHTSTLDDLDLAFESLLLSGRYKVSELLSINLDQIVALSNNLGYQLSTGLDRDLDDSELDSDDDVSV